MSSRGFYIAAAVFLAAFFAYYVFDLHRPAPASSGTPQASPVINLDATTVSQFEVKAGGKTLTVLRNGSEWRYSVCADAAAACPTSVADATRDRKSTRLNSSHQINSYAVFCLEKK